MLSAHRKLLPALPLLISVGTTVAVLASSGCGSVNTGKVAQTVLDVGDAVCDSLEANDVANNNVQIVCKYVNQADGLAHVFIAKVPAPQAARMGLRAPAQGMTEPSAASSATASASASVAPKVLPSASAKTTPSTSK